MNFLMKTKILKSDVFFWLILNWAKKAGLRLIVQTSLFMGILKTLTETKKLKMAY